VSAPGASGTPRRTWWQLLLHWGKRAVLLELWGYVSIFRYVFRRPRVPAGATAFSYHGPVRATVIAFIVVSALELVVVDLLVRRWPTVRIVLLVLGVWGLVWMFGMLFGFLTRPHAVGPAGVRVRSGAEVDIALDWDVIDAVVLRKRIARDEQPLVTDDGRGGCALHLRMEHATNLDVRLTQRVQVRLPHGTETVSTIHLFADAPQAFLSEVHRHCARIASTR
jgi:hypothetical protein